MRRFPARDSRWRTWLPEDASRGAVPFQEANRSRRANRRGAGDVGEQPGGAGGPDAVQVHQGGPAGGDQPGELLVQGPGLVVNGLELAGQPDGEPAAGLAGQVPWLDGGDHGAGLPGGQELHGPAGQHSSSSRCSRLMTWVRGRPSSSRRPASMAITTRSSSGLTWTRPGARRAASATQCASTGPVLRPLPVANTRTCADSSGGTPQTS